jgi:hypothetical protein
MGFSSHESAHHATGSWQERGQPHFWNANPWGPSTARLTALRSG